MAAECAGSDVIATAGRAGRSGAAGVVRMARLLQVSTSGYYQYVKRTAATV